MMVPDTSGLPTVGRAPTAIRPGQVHVWYARTTACSSDELLARYRELLSPDELARLERFAFDYLKREYLLTRALCRTTLSRYGDIAPEAWRFSPNAYGRPEIANPGAPSWLRFNLSNVRSMVVCAVSCGTEVGVDVESLDRQGSTLDIADRYFAPAELADLQNLAPSLRQRRFYELWTLKESYIKARGMGLSIPLERFAFAFDDQRIRVAFEADLGDCEHDWQFKLMQPDSTHLIALAIKRAAEPDHAIRVAEIVPMADRELEAVP